MATTRNAARGGVGLLAVAVLALGLLTWGSALPGGADGNEATGRPFAFRSLTAGEGHTCAIVHNGTVKCWGDNSAGQLGLGDTTNRGAAAGDMGDALPAVNLGTGRTATAITAGDDHTCALLDNGTVKCWGDNVFGQLGLGDSANRGDAAGEMGNALPAVNLGTGRTATAISAGGLHTCAVLDNATLKCWGSNHLGRLGLGDSDSRGGSAGDMGDNLPAVNLGTGRTAVAVSGGGQYTCALLDNATVKCWGSGSDGQLGLGDSSPRGDGPGEMGNNLPAVSLGTGRTATAITTGSIHTCALLDNASIKCWGEGFDGQLGLGDTSTRGDAAGEMGDFLPAVSLGTGRTATGVSADGQTTCARLDNATVKCWGDNEFGELGLGDTSSRGDAIGEMGNALPAVDLGAGRTATAITAGNDHVCALLDNAKLKCWGANGGRLGLGDTADRGDSTGEMGNALPSVRLGGSRAASTVATGAIHTCAILIDATLKCFGAGSVGRLGLGNTTSRGDAGGEMGDALPTVSLGTGRTATAVVGGGAHTCARLDNGTVKCWGENGDGQLGLGDTNDRGNAAGEMGNSLPTVNLGAGRTATALAAGGTHTCAVLDNGTVKCWGANGNGRLGLGDTASRGDAAGEMGDSLPTVNLGAGRTATAITAGLDFTCAVLDNATVKCWGANGNGRLGLGDTAARGDTGGEMGDNLPAVSLGSGRTATAITAGESHACARLDNGTVKCWGLNSSGRLGVGDTAARGDTGGEMGDSLPAISLGSGRTATALTAGQSHTCARLDNGTVKCWGAGTSGQLGLGSTTNRGDQAGEMGDALPAVDLGTGRTATALSVGTGHSCARLDDGTVKCWGLNPFGQLGQGDIASRGDAAGEMGDALLPVDLGSGADSGVSGTVTDVVSAAPVAGAFVVVMRTTDFSLVGGRVADGAGNYTIGVNPGSYFVYVIDPTGAHTAGFHGPPTTVVVPADNTVVDVDPAIAPTRGAIAGTVTETGPNTAIPFAWVLALSASGTLERGVVANASGAFTLPNLAPGNHFVAYIDPTGNHPTRFFPSVPDVPSATPVAVTAGSTATADGSVPTQVPVGLGFNLTGSVTSQSSGFPFPSPVFVLALRASDFALARGSQITGFGGYTLNVAPGQYKLGFIDSSGLHDGEWHDNQPLTNLAGAASVTAPATTIAALSANVGTMSGTVTDDPSLAPVAGAWVLAIGPAGIAGGTVTAADGTYTITNLAPGTYRAAFLDPLGGRTLEYFDGSPDFAGATPLTITAATTTTVDVGLTLP